TIYPHVYLTPFRMINYYITPLLIYCQLLYKKRRNIFYPVFFLNSSTLLNSLFPTSSKPSLYKNTAFSLQRSLTYPLTLCGTASILIKTISALSTLDNTAFSFLNGSTISTRSPKYF